MIGAAGCYWAASFYFRQYVAAREAMSDTVRDAHAATERVGLPSESLTQLLPSPESYFARAEWMFFVAVLMWVVAVVVAFRQKHWFAWLALAVVTAIVVAIPVNILWKQ